MKLSLRKVFAWNIYVASIFKNIKLKKKSMLTLSDELLNLLYLLMSWLVVFANILFVLISL